jgi:hypothetical protein
MSEQPAGLARQWPSSPAPGMAAVASTAATRFGGISTLVACAGADLAHLLSTWPPASSWGTA